MQDLSPGGKNSMREDPGRRLSYWIAHTLRETRESAGVSKAVIASVLGVDQVTVARLESGERWGRDIDRAVLAYAYVLGLYDPRELWSRALEAWYAKGAPPDFSEDELPGSRFLRPIRDEARRHLQPRVEPGGRQSAKRK